MASNDPAHLLKLIRASAANHEYFFDKLDDVKWLDFLVREGFFTKPPNPERGGDWIRFPAWSESRYLVRIARVAPREVFEVVSAIPETSNPRVHQDVLAVAAQLPGEMAAQLALEEARWLDAYSGHLVSLPDAAGELLVHLVKEGESRAAFTLVAALLKIVAAESTGSYTRATSPVGDWVYGRLIKQAWPALMEADAQQALDFLCERLAEILRIESGGGSGRSFSSMWRSAVEDHSQNAGHGLLDTVIDAVRDASLELATVRGPEFALAALDEWEGSIFRRIALHVAQRSGSPEVVANALSDVSMARDADTWHEYGELLHERYVDLEPEQQAAVLDLIAQGPHLRLTPTQEERGLTADDLDRRERYWRLERYSLVAGDLTGEAKAAYDRLVAEFGPPEHPTFTSYSYSWSGPVSPFSAEELREMGPRGTVNALRAWEPTLGEEDPSPEGLGRELRQTVESDAEQFAAAAADFTGLDPTYVRAVVEGLAAAAKADIAFGWEGVLDLSRWVLAQPRNADDPDGGWDRDPHWGWARRQVASLLSHGLAGSVRIPYEARERVWDLLETLARDPEPTPEYESKYGGDNMDPVTLSINTTRGEALHAVIRYALWVERYLVERGTFDGVRSLPEVKVLLDQHLELAVDQSLAIRAVYGQWFAQFVRMDTTWAKALAPRVFPDDQELAEHFDAAWDAYVVFTPVYADVFRVLRDSYDIAVRRLGERRNSKTLAGDPRTALGNHLLSYRLLGFVGLEEGSVFVKYWRAAPADVKQQVVADVGWAFERRDKEPDPEVLARLMETWEWILDDGRTHDEQPLSGFGAWLGVRAFTGDWLLAQAAAVLDLSVTLEPDFTVYEALARLASDHPGEVVRVLRRMVTTTTEEWSLHGSIDEVRQALERVLASRDPAAGEQAQALINLLGARGITQFRDLLPRA